MEKNVLHYRKRKLSVKSKGKKIILITKMRKATALTIIIERRGKPDEDWKEN